LGLLTVTDSAVSWFEDEVKLPGLPPELAPACLMLRALLPVRK
jgi:hypothetical protein